MESILFKIIVLPLLYIVSFLPFPILRLKSYGLYLIVYYLIGYRKTVVTANLKNSFPEKSDEEIRKISKQFYLHFCDVIFETVKLLTMSESSFRKHCVMDEKAIRDFNYFFEKKQTLVGIVGHCGNWEWAGAAHQVYFTRIITSVYRPLSNKNFDKFMIDLRTRFGGQVVSMNQLYKRLLTLKQQNTPVTIGMVADQSAPPESAYWTKFLNQDTAVFSGPEKLAEKFNYPVLYLNIKKVKRNHYSLTTAILTEDPGSLPEGVITEMHIRELEKNILSQPYAWLWSHRRWKHKKPQIN